MARKQSFSKHVSSPPRSPQSRFPSGGNLLAKLLARRQQSKVRRAANEANLKLLKFNRIKSKAPRFSHCKIHTPIFSCVVSTKKYIYGFYHDTSRLLTFHDSSRQNTSTDSDNRSGQGNASFFANEGEEEEEMAEGGNENVNEKVNLNLLNSIVRVPSTLAVARYCKASGHWINRLSGISGDMPSYQWDGAPLFALLLRRRQTILLFFSSALFLFSLHDRKFTLVPLSEAIYNLQRAELGFGLNANIDYSVEIFCAALDPEEKALYLQAGLSVTPMLMIGREANEQLVRPEEAEEAVFQGRPFGNQLVDQIQAAAVAAGPESRVGVFRLCFDDDLSPSHWEKLPLRNDTFGEVMPEGLFMAFQNGTNETASPPRHLFMMIRDLRTRFWVPSVDARFSCQSTIIHIDLLTCEWIIDELKPPPPLELSTKAKSKLKGHHRNKAATYKGHHRRRSTHDQERISVASEQVQQAVAAAVEIDDHSAAEGQEGFNNEQGGRKDLLLKFKTAVNFAFVRPSLLFILGSRDYWHSKTSLWSIDLRTLQWRCLLHKVHLKPTAAKNFLLTATGDAEDGLWALMNYTSFRRTKDTFTAYHVPLEMPPLFSMSRSVLLATLRASGPLKPIKENKVRKAKKKRSRRSSGESDSGNHFLTRMVASMQKFFDFNTNGESEVESMEVKLGKNGPKTTAMIPLSSSVDQQLATWMAGMHIEKSVLRLPDKKEV